MEPQVAGGPSSGLQLFYHFLQALIQTLHLQQPNSLKQHLAQQGEIRGKSRFFWRQVVKPSSKHASSPKAGFRRCLPRCLSTVSTDPNRSAGRNGVLHTEPPVPRWQLRVSPSRVKKPVDPSHAHRIHHDSSIFIPHENSTSQTLNSQNSRRLSGHPPHPLHPLHGLSETQVPQPRERSQENRFAFERSNMPHHVS